MTVVRSSGALQQIAPVPGLPWGWAIPLYGRSLDPATIYRTQPNVRTVVGFLARNIAQLRIIVQRDEAHDAVTPLPTHPLAQVLRNPNPWMTRYQLVSTLVHDLGIWDNAYWLKVRDAVGSSDKGFMLIPIPPPWVVPDGGDWMTADSYVVKAPTSSTKVTYPRSSVVHFHGFNPDDRRIGLSPMITLRRIIAEDASASEYREQMWRSGGRWSSVIERPTDAPEWSDTARERFRRELSSLYASQGPHAGGFPILEDGMTLSTATFTAKDAEYIAARKLTRAEVAAAYHIPPFAVGILDDANYANSVAQRQALYQDTFAPTLVDLEQIIEKELLPELDTDPLVAVHFAIEDKLRGQFEEQAQQLQMAVGGPWLVRDEARARVGLPPLPDGQGTDIITPLNVLSGGQASPRDSAPPPAGAPKGRKRRTKARASAEHVAGATTKLARFFRAQGKTIQGRYGNAKGRKADVGIADLWSDDDTDTWDADLADVLADINMTSAKAAAQAVLDAYPDAGFDPERMRKWLQANASGVAGGVNEATRGRLTDALTDDDPKSAIAHVFEIAAGVRAAQLAVSQTTGMTGFGSQEGAKAAGLRGKAWVVTAANPRPTHAELDGETVALGELFSNGGRWPGDSLLDEDERAGCTCELEFTED